MYCEDVDLNWRARLAGFETAFAPDAVVYHHLSATAGGSLASYYVGRNMLAVLIKDVPLRSHPAVLAADTRARNGAFARRKSSDTSASLLHARGCVGSARICR